jgi:hypothetical protein
LETETLSRKLEVAEAEITRLKLRVEGRPVPYYAVMAEFFQNKLEKFVPADHVCTCNVCCRDLQSIKDAAAKEAR